MKDNNQRPALNWALRRILEYLAPYHEPSVDLSVRLAMRSFDVTVHRPGFWHLNARIQVGFVKVTKHYQELRVTVSWKTSNYSPDEALIYADVMKEAAKVAHTIQTLTAGWRYTNAEVRKEVALAIKLLEQGLA